jgi:Trypsin-like peptidase domain
LLQHLKVFPSKDFNLKLFLIFSITNHCLVKVSSNSHEMLKTNLLFNSVRIRGVTFNCGGLSATLTPEEAFITNPELDFTLVAVAPTSDDGETSLTNYGFLRLDPTLHKVEPLEFVTIIQHPNSLPKQIAIRENQVLQIGDEQDDVKDNFLWYASDTDPGSSGSPVLNDNWQVVAIHHKGKE